MQKRCPYNRMVVNARTNEVEQVTHYSPYGGIIGNLSSNQDAQKYKYSGKELDRTYGLDLYDFHARLYDAIMPSFTSIDPLAEKYYSISPYAYCAGNPVNCVDMDGKDLCILSAPNGAGGLGHMAILIQRPNEDGVNQWFLYSKNGTDENLGFSGASKKDDLKKGIDGNNNSKIGFDSVDDFLQSEYNLNADGTIEYTEGYLLSCDSDVNDQAEKGAIEYIGEENEFKDYSLVGRNCAQTVQNALSKAKFKTGQPSIRIQALRTLSGGSTNDISDRFPNVIYQRIKEQNSGKVIPCKK